MALRSREDTLIEPALAPRDHQHTRPRRLTCDPGKGRDQALVVLARLDGADGQHERRGQPETNACLHNSVIRGRVRKGRVHAEVDDGDALGGHVEALDQVSRGALRDGDDAIGAVQRMRHDAREIGHQAGQGALWMGEEGEVVDGYDGARTDRRRQGKVGPMQHVGAPRHQLSWHWNAQAVPEYRGAPVPDGNHPRAKGRSPRDRSLRCRRLGREQGVAVAAVELCEGGDKVAGVASDARALHDSRGVVNSDPHACSQSAGLRWNVHVPALCTRV